MGKYLYLQWKRISRYLTGAFCVVLILTAGLLLAFSVMTGSATDAEDNQKVQIALCGDVEDPIMQMGLSVITSLDSSRYSIDVQILREEDAAKELEAGEIAAYAVVPEGFMDAAMSGHLIPITMVTTSGSAGIVSVFKEEVTEVIATLVVEAQKGVFGMIDGLDAADMPYQQGPVDALTLEYVDFILCRGDAYSLEELGIADELQFADFLLCGLTVLLILLACLPFAPVLIRQDNAIGRMLAAKGKPLWKQCLCQFLVYFLGLVSVFAALLALAAVGFGIFAQDMLAEFPFGTILANGLSVVMLAAAMSYLLYSLSADLISGVLLQFFVVIAMCFVSGCMYPVYFFPQSVQDLAAWLPTGIARSQLAGIFTGEFAWDSFGALLAYSLVFLAVGCVVRIGDARNGGR